SDNNSATVGTNVEYGPIHQFGGKTRPHVILPRNKQALAFNGRVVKKVNHPGSDIPARPFLALTSDDEEKIVTTVSEYLFKSLL
ncbi:phage virion morphogenesis protein, partial [Serratia fonticola]|uniref:phage virion morphogenesis protein n=1 Tax=Serratia fonticola TaxID=47917 RepID=UPI00301D3B70